MDKLSKQARDEYEKLQARMQALIDRVRVREPKLTEEERAKVAELTGQAEQSKARAEELEKEVIAHDTRLKELERYSVDMVIAGKDACKLAEEALIVKYALSLLETAFSTLSSQHGKAINDIQAIKSLARKRELTEEEG